MRKYDVAVSFMAIDEPLALQVASELAGRAQVFVYSERQKQLAGTDGLEQFGKVFCEESQVCVVLYRDAWGKTTWTGVEETAIKNRGMEHGWDFLLVISLDGKAPVWTPRSHIWLDWRRFGVTAAIAVIERKVTELGGVLRVPSAAEIASAIGRERQRAADTEAFLRSPEAVQLLRQELTSLFEKLKSTTATINKDAPQFSLHVSTDQRDRVLCISSSGFSVSFGWSQPYTNSLQHSSLFIREFHGPYAVGRNVAFDGPPAVRAEYHVKFTLDNTGLPAWVSEQEPTRFRDTDAFAEYYLQLVVQHAHEEPRFQRRRD